MKKYTCAISLKHFDFNTSRYVGTHYFVNLTYFTDEQYGISVMKKIGEEREVNEDPNLFAAITYKRVKQQDLIGEIYFYPCKSEKLINHISHECSHLVFHYYKQVFNVEKFVDTDFEEQYCYTHGYLVKEIYDWLKKKKVI